MNKRARNRLIGVTAIILVIIAAIFGGMSANKGAKSYATVAEIQNDPKAVGTRVVVGGTVVKGSWDRKASGEDLKFAIADKKGDGRLNVVYRGPMPATFGDDVEAIVTGDLRQGGTIESTEMIVKCPEKKSKGTAAMAVDAALQNKGAIAGVPLEVRGFVTAGSVKPVGTEPRFSIQTTDGASVLPVAYNGGIPASVKDGADVVLGGNIDKNGVFNATSVALATK